MVLSAAPQHVAIHDVPPRRPLRHFHTWLETVGTRLEFSTGEPIRLKNERDSTLCSLERGAARLRKQGCGFRRKSSGYSDLMSATVPI
jgi:hypothetical protein